MSKVVEYVGLFHVLKDRVKESWTQFWLDDSPSPNLPESEDNFQSQVKKKLEKLKRQTFNRIDSSCSEGDDFSHLTRPKTRGELVQISAAVMGIEFSYAAETAFVSPLLLNIGLRHRHMTLMWCLSPLVGFFVTPLLGSLSDGCRSRLGRRRPFIILLSLGVILGLILVPNGQLIGRWLGDSYPSGQRTEPPGEFSFLLHTGETSDSSSLQAGIPQEEYLKSNRTHFFSNSTGTVSHGERGTTTPDGEEDAIKNHPWGLIFTVLGTVLLDFDADACQSPSRAYMLDVTIPEDHTRGLSTFTVMAGLGGSIGYFMGGLNWENTFLGHFFGGQVRAVFTLVLFIFMGCVIATVRSFREIPIDRLWTANNTVIVNRESNPFYSRIQDDHPSSERKCGGGGMDYGSVGKNAETSFNAGLPECNEKQEKEIPETAAEESGTEATPTFREYVKTIVQLPKSLQWLCLTNFFCWMSLVCYSLYFTDFVGEAVFHGDPTAPIGSPPRQAYEDGVRFGCWGMSLYSLSCSIYSLAIENLVNRFGAKRVYIWGQLVYSVGMVCMAIARHPAGVIIFSWTAGIMYATLFTMPYLLVARYHAADTFDVDIDDLVTKPTQMRGLGTDVAVVSSMVFLAQMTQSVVLGSIVTAAGTTTAIVLSAAVLAACGAVSATRVLYLDL